MSQSQRLGIGFYLIFCRKVITKESHMYKRVLFESQRLGIGFFILYFPREDRWGEQDKVPTKMNTVHTFL